MKVWMACEALTEVSVSNVTVLEIRRNLKGLGHEVLLFCPSTEKKHASLGDPDVYFVPTVNIRWLRLGAYQLSLALSMLLCCLRSRPDCIYTRTVLTMISPAVIARIVRVPQIVHLSGDPLEQMRALNKSLLLRGLYWIVERVNCRLSHRVIVETDRNRVRYLRRHRLPFERVVALPNGANTQLFSPMDTGRARAEVGVDIDSLYVGYVGNLTEEESVELLLRTAPLVVGKVPQARFLIVGDGPTAGELGAMARKDGASDMISFAGCVPYERVPLYIGAMDVCTVPLSRARFERTGVSSLKLREYLACGRPVVGSDIDGVADILREAEAGIAVTPENTPEFAEAIVKLLRDSRLRAKMGENGRRFAEENLGWELFAARLIEEFEQPGAKRHLGAASSGSESSRAAGRR